MLKLKTNDIKDFPFKDYAELKPSELEELAKEHCLSAYNNWMLPQINAYLATWKLKRNVDGSVNCNDTAKHNITTKWDLGVWRVLTKLKRGSLVKVQSNPEFVNFSALVPIILAAHKRFNGVKYMEWDIQEDCHLIDKALLDAMLYRGCPTLGSERLLEIREHGLTTKSGANVGKVTKATSSWCLKGISDTELAEAPKLFGTMLTQIWVADPSLRTEYMVLDPYDWDRMPPPLIAERILVPQQPIISKEETVDMPW